MGFKAPITIKEAIGQIYRHGYVLPAIQREFVWSPEQITQLFDSLMRGYPIGSFLYWTVDKASCHKYKFYGFICEFHERDNRHNPEVDVSAEQGVTAILDGQQRFTSLYIGLKGSYADKKKYKRWTSDDAFPKRRLYLNLLKPAPETPEDLSYNFRFLAEDEACNDDECFWFPVGKILTFDDLPDVFDYLRTNEIITNKYASDCLCRMFQVINKDALINYFQEEAQDLDKVLNIFIRVNSGGTQLSYSDLLLSIATAQWEDRDARQVVHELVDDLNRTGSGFLFSKDFVLKSSLVLTDISEIGFKVENFTAQNMKLIESQWPSIAQSLRMSVDLVSRLGYSDRTLTAKNVLIPIAYYLLNRGLPSGYSQRGEFAEDRGKIKLWIARALLKSGTFGSGLDTTLRAARKTINNSSNGFPVVHLDSEFARIGRSLRFEPEEIDDLLDLKYGQQQTFTVLSLLYPHLDFSHRLHEDHIFPKSKFTRRRLIAADVPEVDVDEFIEKVNMVPNIQLLEGIPNEEKAAKLPHEWAESFFDSSEAFESWK